MAEIHNLHHYNCTHIAIHAEHEIDVSLDALDDVAKHRPDMLNADVIRLHMVRLRKLLHKANMAEINRKLIERGRT